MEIDGLNDSQSPVVQDFTNRADLAADEPAEGSPEKGRLFWLLVLSQVNLAPAVLFSAAVPHQEGEHHINEQWPDYWAKRFLSKGYVPIDCLRKQLWDNDEIDWWYAQNLIMFVKQSDLGSYDRLSAYTGQATLNQFALVHPRNYLRVVWKTRVLRAEVDLADIIPAGNCFILVDQDQFGDLHLAGDGVCCHSLNERESIGGLPPTMKPLSASWNVFDDVAPASLSSDGLPFGGCNTMRVYKSTSVRDTIAFWRTNASLPMISDGQAKFKSVRMR